MPTLESVVAHATELRHQLHQKPELTWAEHSTAEFVRRELTRLGIPWTRCADTGSVARLAVGKSGRHIAIRADLDALPINETSGVPWTSTVPGKMHACGHDGHTACLLGAAAWLKAHESRLPGPVTLMFQPAEEWGHGARRMVQEGCLDGIDAVFGFHNWPGFPDGQWACPDGTLMASNASWKAVITGRGTHAAAPHDGIDPILVGAHFTTLAQQLVSRITAPQEAAVVGVTSFHAGTANNIIPDTAELLGTIRSSTTTKRDALAVGLERMLHAACTAAGATGEFIYEPMYPATVNHASEAIRARAALERVYGPGKQVAAGVPIMGSEDFSYYLEKKPGAYILLGTGRDGRREPCHSPRFDFDDRLIPIVVRLWADLAGLG